MHGDWANESDTPPTDMLHPACYDGTWENNVYSANGFT